MLGDVHAADLRAVLDALGRVARADALEEDDAFRFLAVGRADDLARRRPRGRGQALELQAVDHVRDRPVAVLAVAGEPRRLLLADRVERVPGGDDDRADLLGDERVRLLEVDGSLAAGLFALAAGVLLDALGLGLEVGAVVAVDHRDVRHRLRERHVDRGPLPEALVELGGDLADDARLLAGAAAVARRGVDVARLLADRDREVADVARDLLHLAVGQEPDVGVLDHLHHARGEDALRAVEGRERLGELAHVAADRRLLLDEDHLGAAVGDVERRLDAGDAAADHERPPVPPGCGSSRAGRCS